jgi:hypothetical protein
VASPLLLIPVPLLESPPSVGMGNNVVPLKTYAWVARGGNPDASHARESHLS